MEVIPAINTTSSEEAKKQIATASEFADLIHIDVVDGVFAPNVTWGSPNELKPVASGESLVARFEVHLMVANPEGVIDDWLRMGLVKRVIVHLEAMTDSVYILAKCKKYGVEAMLAINPGTQVERLLAYRDDFQYFQILAVYPGLAGQQFKEEVINKIKFLRKAAPNAKIEVDGGINPETAKRVKEAGADILISASYIFGSDNPKKAYEQLKI